jgi:arabinan endo-1,5-alpha-L-arabinosidase
LNVTYVIDTFQKAVSHSQFRRTMAIGGTSTLTDIQIRDPFVLPVASEGAYYLFGSTDADIWSGPGTGFDCYRSVDLNQWEGPLPAFRPDDSFEGYTEFWAPEVHAHLGRYYMFATFKAPGAMRGTYVLAAERPEGPYIRWSPGAVTPANWQCLDGTFHVDDDGAPWLIYCHEWVQVHDGAVYAQRLSPDLRSVTGPPVFLFSSSEAAWSTPLKRREPLKFPAYVTDGPFLRRTAAGELLMVWSAMGSSGYAMGVARSESGRVEGPWTQDPDPVWPEDGGHGMIFDTFDGTPVLTLHHPNRTPDERAVLQPLPAGQFT